MFLRFRKKPVVIEAMRFLGLDHPDNYVECGTFCPDMFTDSGVVFIRTLEGDHQCTPGDWIIKGVKGEFYPCKPDIFEATYEPVEGE